MVAQSTHCFAFVGKPQSGIRELSKRGILPACQGSPREKQNRASNTLKIHPPALHVLIGPCTFSVKTKMFSWRSQVPRLPREVATWGACLLPAYLAGKSAQHRSRQAGQPRSQSACLPACLPKLGTQQSLQSRELPGSWQAAGAGQPCVPGAPGLEEREAEEAGLGGHPVWGLPRSWAAPEPGSWEPVRRARWQVAPHPT